MTVSKTSVGATRTILIVAALLFLISIANDAAAQSKLPRDDVQEWNELQLIAPVHPRIDLVLDGQVRFGDQISRVVIARGSAGFAFRLNNHFTLTPAYVYQAAEPLPDRKTIEHRITLTGALKFSLGKFTFSDNNLVERRLLNSRADATRYRNRLRVEHPVDVRDFKLDVFLSDEVYYDWSVNAWARNRFYVGGGKRLSDQFYAEIFYLKQNDGHVRPGDLNAVGTVLRVRL